MEEWQPKFGDMRKLVEKSEMNFVEGDEKNSSIALGKLKKLVESELEGRFEQKNCDCDFPEKVNIVHEGNIAVEVFKRCAKCGGLIEPRL